MTNSHREHEAFANALRAALASWHLEPTGAQVDQLVAHYAMMLGANRITNLTRITEPTDAAIMHYADSLALALWARHQGLDELELLDVGTGAGFPAVPLAILQPSWRITAIDGTRKKVDFVRSVIDALGLRHLDVAHAHADHWPTDSTFDVVCVRAVASVVKCMPFAGRLTARNGWFVAYKTVSAYARELAEAKHAADEHGMQQAEPFDYSLEMADETMARRLLILHRIGG